MNRYKLRSNGKHMHLCKGKNDTCMKEPKKGGFCTGCISGHDRTQFFGRKEGEIFIANGIRYKYSGGQSRQLCIGDNYHCTSMRDDGTTNKCRFHKNNGKPRVKSKGEDIIAKFLTALGIKHENNKYVKYNDKVMYLDFIFIFKDKNIVLEFDGKQHFIPVKHWGGQESFEKRIKADLLKDNWARENNFCMLRISHSSNIINILHNYLTVDKLTPGIISSSEHPVYVIRNYNIIPDELQYPALHI